MLGTFKPGARPKSFWTTIGVIGGIGLIGLFVMFAIR
jgi:hypothetical protein